MAGELADLVPEPDQLGKLTRGIMTAVATSFAEDGSRQTRSEIKRRFDICVGVFRQLRAAPLHRSMTRIVDELPHALRHHLDGIPWDPASNRTIYVPGGYKRLIE